MNDLLLSDILTAEREISQRIAAVEKEAAASLEELKRTLEAELAQAAERLQVETARRVEAAATAARREAAAVIEQATAYAGRLQSLADGDLDRALSGVLARLLQEDDHDRHNGQT